MSILARLRRLEAAITPIDAGPFYYAVEDEAGITPEMAGAKVYIGISPRDWDDTPEDDEEAMSIKARLKTIEKSLARRAKKDTHLVMVWPEEASEDEDMQHIKMTWGDTPEDDEDAVTLRVAYDTPPQATETPQKATQTPETLPKPSPQPWQPPQKTRAELLEAELAAEERRMRRHNIEMQKRLRHR